MEYISINESKIKIICEEKDLELYGVSAQSLEYGEASSRSFLDSLLEKAKSKLGFDTAKHRILIQLFPSNDGGCEIFVSKLGLLKKLSDASSFSNASSNSNSITAKENDYHKKAKEVQKKLFFFEKLNFLLEACKRFSLLEYSKNSSAFYLDGHGYYLYFEVPESSNSNESKELEEYGITSLDEYSFLLEYGEPQSIKENLPYLKEYAKNICKEKAIEKLSVI